MEEAPSNFPLYEPVSPENLVPPYDLMLVVWLSVAALVLVISLVAFLIFLHRRKKSSPALAAARHMLAYKNASRALENLAVTDSRDAATKVSLILRQYLADALADPSLFETHEEFLLRKNTLASLDEATRHSATTHFDRLAKFKYSTNISTENPQALVAESRALLETLRGGIKP